MVIYINGKQRMSAQETVYFLRDNQVAFVFVNRSLQYLHARSADNMVILLRDTNNCFFSNFEILKVLLLYGLFGNGSSGTGNATLFLALS